MSNTDNNRLDRIEAIVESNGRAIRAMLEARATERLQHEERIYRLEMLTERVARVQFGVTRMLSSIDEDRPTMLRKLNTIENNVDRINSKLDPLRGSAYGSTHN